MKTGTLHLNRAFGQTIAITLVILGAFFVILEFGLRSDFVQPYLNRLNPSLGGRHLQMEEQLARLDRVAAVDGRVDCIFLGSSLVWLGFNPDVFYTDYKAETGQGVHCFNLGIESLPTNAASAVAEVVVAKYQPKLLIYGTSARDYAVGSQVEDSRVVLDTPWLQYQLGQHTPYTWLMSHSYTLRYLRELSNLLKMDQDTWNNIRYSMPLSRGFLGKMVPATPTHFEAATKDAAQWLQPYDILPENLEGLRRIAGEQAQGIQVVVVEMPVSAPYFGLFEQGKTDYDRFVVRVGNILAEEEVVFLRPPEELIPEVGWWEWSHMNKRGADIFSRWMAQRMAQMAAEGTLTMPVTAVTDHDE